MRGKGRAYETEADSRLVAYCHRERVYVGSVAELEEARTALKELRKTRQKWTRSGWKCSVGKLRARLRHLTRIQAVRLAAVDAAGDVFF